MHYSKGIVAIPHVTGNIVITATGVPTAATPKNILTENFIFEGTSYTARGITEGVRVSSSNGDNSIQDGAFTVTKTIPIADRVTKIVITASGYTLPAAYAAGNALAWYSQMSDGHPYGGFIAGDHLTSAGATNITCSQEGDVVTIEVAKAAYTAGVRAIRFSFAYATPSNVVVNLI